MTPARPRRSLPSGSYCCPTAPRTIGPRTIGISSSWREVDTAPQTISSKRPRNAGGFLLYVLGVQRRCGGGPVRNTIRKSLMTRDQMLDELRNAYEGGASIRNLVATTGRSYGSIHSMLR